MIEFLKNWISTDEEHVSECDDNLLQAICALLLEAAMIDGQIDDEEIEQTKHAICSFFDVSEEQASQMIRQVKQSAGDSQEFHSLTKQIRDKCDYEEREYILSLLWQIVMADNQIDSLESSLMRRLAGLLFVSDVDSGKAKQKARERLGLA